MINGILTNKRTCRKEMLPLPGLESGESTRIVDAHYAHFENFSLAADVSVVVLDLTGQMLFASSAYRALTAFLQTLYAALDCGAGDQVSLLYGCYQAQRFGGRYIFYAPSGLAYCAAPLLDNRGKMHAGVLAGPFIMHDYDEFMEVDVLARHTLAPDESETLRNGICAIPRKNPRQVYGISELLYNVSTTDVAKKQAAQAVPIQTDILFSSSYSIEKEEALLSAISRGDIHTANTVLKDIQKQIVVGSNLEVLRSRVVELIVLLSRAALKGGADIHIILGLNYSYLQEIDSFSSVEDLLLWLQTVTRKFSQHVFDFSTAKHADIIYRAVDYIKRKYAEKLTLQDIADYLLISQSYFCRIFKEETGQTPGNYITCVRIEESKKLLRNSSVNITEIPEHVGFEGQSYFTRIFKKVEGITPGRYRRKNLGSH